MKRLQPLNLTILLIAILFGMPGFAQNSSECVFTLNEREIRDYMPDQPYASMAGSNIVFYEGMLGVMTKDEFVENIRGNRERNLEPFIQVIRLSSGDKKMFAGKLDYVLVLWSKRDANSRKYNFLKKIKKSCFRDSSTSSTKRRS